MKALFFLFLILNLNTSEMIKVPLERLLDNAEFKKSIADKEEIIIFRSPEFVQYFNVNQKTLKVDDKVVKVNIWGKEELFMRAIDIGDGNVIQISDISTDDAGKFNFKFGPY